MLSPTNIRISMVLGFFYYFSVLFFLERAHDQPRSSVITEIIPNPIRQHDEFIAEADEHKQVQP